MSADYASLSGEYVFDPAHTTIGFVARHAMVTKVRGGFNEFEGKIHVDGGHPENSSAEATVKVASVDTRNEQRNGHLLSGDFFEQEKYPDMVFRSTGVTAKGGDGHRDPFEHHVRIAGGGPRIPPPSRWTVPLGSTRLVSRGSPILSAGSPSPRRYLTVRSRMF